MTDRHLRVRDLTAAFEGATVLDHASLDVPAGHVVAVLGPSGSGKTTLLRCIAGLERPVAGTVTLGDSTLTDAGPAAVHVAPERRGVGMVFQDWALFPHMSVGANVGFGLARGERQGRRVGEVLEMVGLAGTEDRAPATLSGGEQQRVALARALAPRPEVLLLDEPFSNLDASLRTQVRTEVHRLLTDAGVTSVFVTHDQAEAFVLGDSVAVVREGRVVQQDPPATVYLRPADPWVAGFVGDANLLDGQASGGEATTALGRVGLAAPATGPVTVLIRPEEIAVTEGGDDRVTIVEYLGHDTVLHVTTAGGLALRVRSRGHRWQRGDAVTVTPTLDAAMAWPT